jgi:chlorite dismutase
MSDAYVHALALGIDRAWRRLPCEERRESLADWQRSLRDVDGVKTFTYTMVGLHPGADLMLWSLADSYEGLEERAAAVLRSELGAWCSVTESLVGVVRPSQYVKRPTAQEQSLFQGERARYLVVYPFTKSADWYLLGREARQGIMNEHIRVGHDFPQVRQLLANSFGIDDMDFLVAYETDDLAVFGDLVRALRGTESRRSTVRDTPILVGVHRQPSDIERLLGG